MDLFLIEAGRGPPWYTCDFFFGFSPRRWNLSCQVLFTQLVSDECRFQTIVSGLVAALQMMVVYQTCFLYKLGVIFHLENNISKWFKSWPFDSLLEGHRCNHLKGHFDRPPQQRSQSQNCQVKKIQRVCRYCWSFQKFCTTCIKNPGKDGIN